MQYVIQGFEPAEMFRYFEEISAIPRSSGNEGGVADYLEAFASEHGLSCYRDELFNVIIKKPGSAGYENQPPVMLQAHSDMVCVKDPGVEHDFDRDGIELVVDGDILRAKGTSLGGDDLSGMVIMLQILADKSLKHPPLECVFTSQEEVGMVGAMNLDMSQLQARTMINLDSGGEGHATVGCAGGLRVAATREVKQVFCGEHCGLTVDIHGLLGGHSGGEIDKEHGNANKMMSRILYHLSEQMEMHLVYLHGGSKDNAIPSECRALVAFLDERDRQQAMKLVEKMAAEIKAEYGSSEPGLTITFAPFVEVMPQRMVDKKVTRTLLEFLYLAPTGVKKRNYQEGFVVASLNFATVNVEDGKAEVVFSPRSSIQSLQDETRSELALLCRMFDFEMSCDNEYPGWAFAEQSPIREVFAEAVPEVLGVDFHYDAIHAGLECGLFGGALPGLDAIAVGIEAGEAHTPKEYLSLSSLSRGYRLVARVLEKLAQRA